MTVSVCMCERERERDREREKSYKNRKVHCNAWSNSVP